MILQPPLPLSNSEASLSTLPGAKPWQTPAFPLTPNYRRNLTKWWPVRGVLESSHTCLPLQAGRLASRGYSRPGSSRLQARTPIPPAKVKAPEPENPASMEETDPPVTPTADMAQFGQLLADRQEQLLKAWMAQQQEAQSALIRDLSKAWGPKGGGTPPSPAKTPMPQLTKLTTDDDVEAYLEVFERVAEMVQWPREQWAYMLSLYLTAGSQGLN